MEHVIKVVMDYAGAFEKTYADDDWSRLAPYFAEDAKYEVCGGPFACQISGREAIFAGLKKSIDGLDRRCSDRQIEVTEGPDVQATEVGHELSLGWNVAYHYGDAPRMVLPGRSVFNIVDGVIVAMRDEYDDKELESVHAWMLEHGQGLDGSYV